MKKSYLAIFIFLFCSCSTWNKLDDTEKGAIIGGGTGAVVGSAVSPGAAGTIAGGAIGAVGGGLIGNEVEKNKRRRYYD